MFDQAQLRKGTLEGCILKIIDREPTYGYAIATTLRDSGFADLTEGTLYPLLLRLERKGLIAAEYRAGSGGPTEGPRSPRPPPAGPGRDHAAPKGRGAARHPVTPERSQWRPRPCSAPGAPLCGRRRVISSVGRASRLHRECRRFEPVIAHHPLSS